MRPVSVELLSPIGFPVTHSMTPLARHYVPDLATGMVTLEDGAQQNAGMPPMTTTFKAKDAALVKQVTRATRSRFALRT